jgi:HAD superfamily hydrolase (TIGR01459 family)
MMDIPILAGLAEIADDYDLFIIDLWGVVHDGVTVYPDAVHCLRGLRQRGSRVVLLSNTARPSHSIAAHLMELGVEAEMYDWLLTSGDVTAIAVAARAEGRDDDGGSAYFHLGPERCRPTLDACGGREVALDAAALIICTGLFDDETEQVADYAALLKSAVARGLPMVCANPDIVAQRGGKFVPCAGAVAALYEELGGAVQRLGKPFPYIFDRLFAETPEIPRSRAVMIGDGLATDIRGARLSGIDAVWIGGGIHSVALDMGPEGQLRPDKVQDVANRAGERPKAILPWLNW